MTDKLRQDKHTVVLQDITYPFSPQKAKGCISMETQPEKVRYNYVSNIRPGSGS